MRKLWQAGLLLLLAACGDSTSPLPPTSFDVSGIWQFSEAVADAAVGVSCSGTGLVTVTQNGSRFTAAGSESGDCTTPGGTQSFADTEIVQAGTINGTAVSFRVDACPYNGTIYGGNRPDSAAGTVSCNLSVQGTTIHVTGRWRLVPPPDDVPPVVDGNIFGGHPDTLTTGDDTLRVRIHATDNRALRTLGYELTDPSRFQVVRRDSVLVSGTAADDTLSFPLALNLILPVPPGTPFQAALFARDSAGNLATVTLPPVTVVPAAAPVASGTLSGATNDTASALRDTLRIHVAATGDRPLVWLGYRITTFASLGDSVAGSGSAGSHDFTVPIPFEWKGLLLQVEVFARDRLGLEGTGGLPSTRVVVRPTRPTQIFRVGQGVSDMLYDPGRNQVYLTTAVDTGVTAGTPEIKVFRLSPAGFLPGIILPWFSEGLDLSTGGDSLIVSMYNDRLGVINLQTMTMDSTDPIQFTTTGGYLFRIRVLANNKAMVGVASGTGTAGQLVAYDLATSAQAVRTDLGASGAIGVAPEVERSRDRQHLVVYPAGAGAAQGQLYQVATDQFQAAVAVAQPSLGRIGLTGDATGSRWLAGNSLLHGDLSPDRTLGGSQLQGAASALTDDGGTAYVAVPEGVARFRTSDGQQLEQILLPDPPYLMILTPDGNTLLGVGSPGLMVVDLR